MQIKEVKFDSLKDELYKLQKYSSGGIIDDMMECIRRHKRSSEINFICCRPEGMDSMIANSFEGAVRLIEERYGKRTFGIDWFKIKDR